MFDNTQAQNIEGRTSELQRIQEENRAEEEQKLKQGKNEELKGQVKSQVERFEKNASKLPKFPKETPLKEEKFQLSKDENDSVQEKIGKKTEEMTSQSLLLQLEERKLTKSLSDQILKLELQIGVLEEKIHALDNKLTATANFRMN